MSNSGLNDVAAMGVFIGAGITVARTYAEASEKGVVDNRWAAQRSNAGFVSAVEKARVGQPVMKVNEFFEQRAKIKSIIDARVADLADKAPEWADGMKIERFDELVEAHNQRLNIGVGLDLADESLKKSLVHSYGLQGTLAGMPGALEMAPENMTDDMLRALLEMSPSHMQHAERVYGSMGLLEGTAFGRGSEDAAKAITGSLDRLVGEFGGSSSLKSTPLPGVKNMAELVDVRGVSSFDELWNAVASIEGGTAADEPERFKGILGSIYEKVGDTKGASIGLRYFNDADGPKLAGININMGEGIDDIHLGLRHKSGVVFGDTPTKAYSSALVYHPEAERHGLSGKGRVVQNADIAMMDLFNNRFDEFANGGWNSEVNKLIGGFKSEEAKLLMPVQENPMITERRRYTVITHNSGVVKNLSEAADATLKNRLVADKHVLIQGIKAEGWENGHINFKRGAVPGMSIMGQGPGADKEISQRETSRVLNDRGRKVRMRAASGRQLPQRMTSYSMPGDVLEAFYRGMQMHAQGSHEDVSWLLDKGATARYKQNIHIPLDSKASASLLEAQKTIADGGVARLNSNQILGIGMDGTPIRLQGKSEFLVKEMLTDSKKGVLTLVGHREEVMGDMYKQFGGMKVVHQQGGSRQLGMEAIALAEHLKENGKLTPEAMEELAKNFRESGRNPLALGIPEWSAKMKTAFDVQFIGTQGVKKIAEKGVDVLAESLTEQIGGRIGELDQKARAPYLAQLAEMGIDVQVGHGRHPRGKTARHGPVPRGKIGGQFRRGPSPVAITIQDTGEILEGKGNLVNRTRELMLMASDEGGLLKGRLSLSSTLKQMAEMESVKALENGSLARTLSSAGPEEAMAISRALLFGTNAKEKLGEEAVKGMKDLRRSFIQTAEQQIKYGIHTVTAAAGGPSDVMLGAGQRGSFAQSSIGHLRAQGGVMGDVAIDLAARTTDSSAEAAKGLHSRIASFYSGGAKGQIPIETLGKAIGPHKGMMNGLFSINQAERNAVFNAVGKLHGMSPEDIAKMDHMNIGLGDGKSIFIERDASKLSGPFVTDSGIAITTDMDKATKAMILATQNQDTKGFDRARTQYADALKSQATGPESPLLREFSGKTHGSLRTHAIPNRLETGVLGDTFDGQVGLRNAAYKKMLQDNMGLGADEIDARMAAFKSGEGGYGVLARDPSVDLHRATGVKFFSIDEAMKMEAQAQASAVASGGRTADEQMNLLRGWAEQEGVRSKSRPPKDQFAKIHENLRRTRTALWRLENDPNPLNRRMAQVKEKLADIDARRVEALAKLDQRKTTLQARRAELNGEMLQALKQNRTSAAGKLRKRVLGIDKALTGLDQARVQAESGFRAKMADATPSSLTGGLAAHQHKIEQLRNQKAALEAQFGTSETREAARIEGLRKEAESIPGKVARQRLRNMPKEGAWIPRGLEQILGADYDADQLTTALLRNGETESALKTRVDMRLALGKDYKASGLGLKEYIKNQQGTLGDNVIGRAALEDFSYSNMMDTLYGSVLKDAHKGAILEAADVLEGTPEFAERVRGQMIAANLEKGKVGPITNVSNLIRDTLRVGDDAFKSVQGRIFGEALLGLMPEMVLKARQPGPRGLIEADMEGHMEQIRKIMSNDSSIASAWTRDQKIAKFQESFKAIYKPSGATGVAAEYIDNMMSFVPNIVDAATATDQSERGAHSLAKLLKDGRTATTPGRFEQAVAHMADATNTSPQAESFKNAAKGLGIAGEGEFSKNIKNAKATFGDIIDLVGKHKKPALLGLGIGMGISLLSSPGSISAEEADSAGARHSPSSPSQEGPNFGDSAPVSVGPGKSIRVRGTSQGDIDAASASRILQDRYPGADVSYNMQDHREQINQEYLRKRLMR